MKNRKNEKTWFRRWPSTCGAPWRPTRLSWSSRRSWPHAVSLHSFSKAMPEAGCQGCQMPCLHRFTLRYSLISGDCAVLSSDESPTEITYLLRVDNVREVTKISWPYMSKARCFWKATILRLHAAWQHLLFLAGRNHDTIHPTTMVDRFGCLDQFDFKLDLCGWNTLDC